MPLNSLRDLFVEQLQDLYDAEKRLVTALPEMANAASDADLKDAFKEHLEQTRNHVSRLEQVFQDLGQRPGGETCQAMVGLIQEGQQVLKENGVSAVRDAALIAAAQRVEHYEIAGYGTVNAYAKELGYDTAQDLLQETLNEEGAADKKLNKIATGGLLGKGINVEAKA